ncbi:hypothetical protein BGX33_010277 [Mortierella sp. NVP41]|nr:hypothetical protein BGX33_010277 [Mortierella sp. NVP41]
MKNKARFHHILKSDQDKGTSVTVAELEAQIKPYEHRTMPSDPSQDKQQRVWRSLQSSIEGHMASIVQVQEPLHQFYRSRAFKIKTRLLKAPTSATKHKGIDKVIHAAR